MTEPVRSFVNATFIPHALDEMQRRGITEASVRAVLQSPQQVQSIRPGRVVVQALQTLGNPGRTYVMRIFVDIDRNPPEVVTVYRSSKIQKYWRLL